MGGISVNLKLRIRNLNAQRDPVRGGGGGASPVPAEPRKHAQSTPILITFDKAWRQQIALTDLLASSKLRGCSPTLWVFIIVRRCKVVTPIAPLAHGAL